MKTTRQFKLSPLNELAPPVFTVLVKASRSIVNDLTIDSVNEPENAEASVIFITKAGKKWKMRLSEFSFVFPATQPKAA